MTLHLRKAKKEVVGGRERKLGAYLKKEAKTQFVPLAYLFPNFLKV